MRLIDDLFGYLYCYMSVMNSDRGLSYIYIALIPMTLLFFLLPLLMPLHFLYPERITTDNLLAGVVIFSYLIGIIAWISLDRNDRYEQVISQPKFKRRRAIFIGALIRLGSAVFFVLYVNNGVWIMKTVFNLDVQSVF
ncbi:MAG: hypothetical protein K2M72_07010 [Paramuribaculum sp.]|nr:hypothetical protein [Paramuribaculum sp.]